MSDLDEMSRIIGNIEGQLKGIDERLVTMENGQNNVKGIIMNINDNLTNQRLYVTKLTAAISAGTSGTLIFLGEKIKKLFQ